MDERKNFINKVEREDKTPNGTKKAVLFAVIAIALFISGYLFAWNLYTKSSDNVELLYDAESFSIDSTSTLSVNSVPFRITSQNGEVAIARDMGQIVFRCIVMGILFVTPAVLLRMIIVFIGPMLKCKSV